MATNGAPTSTDPKPAVTDEVRKVFKSFDSNGDGKISVNELGNVLTALGSTVSDDELKRFMVDLDTDNDGFICLDEFNAFWVAGPKDGGVTELKDAFDLYDQDRNGLISANELHLVLNRLNMPCTIEDCHRMIKTVDADGDGNVNFEEFKKMMGHKASADGTNAANPAA
ncbi:probable calcium-binding protein CML27 [Pyrus x bretschneideri]|uniref:probable calcium-binding protein CML27 n=1 Tax=Pyrus x bretschneideri TaxID=225117 RepID=UPI0020304A9F|nr:probable calcium-binding protein CML27 [Pyrus x bretschneideri]XP_048445284.1 probable calcium-binding protein CML27 [Pyrus x bretschneideri]